MATQTRAQGGESPQAVPANSVLQYVTFMLDAEEYGIDILRVQEIRGWEPVTPIPKSPDYVRGVMNLRGEVVPVLDMRRRFDLEPVEYGPTTVVVVVKVAVSAGEDATMGLVVDAISEVYDIDPGHISATPDVGCAVEIEFLKGIAMVDDKMIILLDVNRLIGIGTLGALRGRAA